MEQPRGEKRQLPEALTYATSAGLADAMEEALDAMTEETYDSELIQAYLDMLEEKAPVPEGETIETAHMRLMDALQRTQEKRPPKKTAQWWRYFSAVAASIGILFVLMIGAQAAGWNVFGALAQWTDKTFHFIPHGEGVEEVQEILRDQELPPELAPTWYPEGFEMGEAEIQAEEDSVLVILPFSNGEKKFQVEVTRHKEPMGILNQIFFKNNSRVENYIHNGRSFYLFKNGGQSTAAWSDGNSLVISIIGEISTDDLRRMIDSIAE